MIRHLLTVLLASLLFLPARAQVFDSFTDGDLSTAPQWAGDLSSFTTENGKLKSNNTTDWADFAIGTQLQMQGALSWEIWINLKFLTSSQNYADFVLMCDSPGVRNMRNGYFVRVGNTKDEVSLYRMVNGVSAEIISGADGSVGSSDNLLRVRVTRDAGRKFSLYRDPGASSHSWQLEGAVTDSVHKSLGWCGIRVKQSTPSFHNRHYFDDFSVTAYVEDVAGPVLTGGRQRNNTELEISFDETVTALSASDLQNFRILPGNQQPLSVKRDSTRSNTVVITVSLNLNSSQYIGIKCQNIQDIFNNNSIQDTVWFWFHPLFIPRAGEIGITEIMANPQPAAGNLPPKEYVEIHNFSGRFLQLKNLIFSDAASSVPLPDSILRPYEYVVLCAESDLAGFLPFGRCVGLSSLPSLNNSGDELSITNGQGEWITGIRYSDAMYGDNFKKIGGYSLEMLDTMYPCVTAGNWRASNSANGGTPGAANSVSTAIPAPEKTTVLGAAVLPGGRTAIEFSRQLSKYTASSFMRLSTGDTAIAVDSVDYRKHIVWVNFADAFAPGKTEQLRISAVQGCTGDWAEDTVPLGLGVNAASGGIVLNEILYDPIGDDPDFVELYNGSDLAISLADVSIARNGSGGVADDFVFLPEWKNLYPGEYAVLSENSGLLRHRYPGGRRRMFCDLDKMPTYVNGEGTVFLYYGGTETDKLEYSDNMHSTLYGQTEGISLERLQLNEPAIPYDGTWLSSDLAGGGATPGRMNSRNVGEAFGNDLLKAVPEVFSPDGDGTDDLAAFQVKADAGIYLINLRVFDANGIPVAWPVKGVTLSGERTFVWDGLNTDGRLARPGLYVAMAELTSDRGEVKRAKVTFALAMRQ